MESISHIDVNQKTVRQSPGQRHAKYAGSLVPYASQSGT